MRAWDCSHGRLRHSGTFICLFQRKCDRRLLSHSPEVVHLLQLPTEVYPSPELSYFLVLTGAGSGMSLQAYRLSDFGKTEGIPLDIADLPTNDLALTSFVNRTSVHLLSLDVAAQKCRSVALALTMHPATFFCCVCLEEHLEEVVARVEPCEHLFCRDSLRGYIGSKLDEHRFPIICPACVAEPKGRKLTCTSSELSFWQARHFKDCC